jgi:hypothetical protein
VAGALAGLAALALAAALALTLYGPLDKNPVAVRFEGEQMQLENAAGQVVERITVGEHVVGSAKAGGYRAYDLYDVDGDGRSDVCWGQAIKGERNAKTFVACQRVGDDAPLWVREAYLDIRFPGKPYVRERYYNPRRLTLGDFDGEAGVELYATVNHSPYFPGVLLKLDALTGEEQGRYVNPGNLRSDIKPVDLEGDGITELVVGGMTNAHDEGVVTILDPRLIRGHAPLTPEYRVEGYAPAAERAYVRLPATVVHNKAPNRPIQPPVYAVFTDGGLIEAYKLDGTTDLAQGREDPHVIAQFTYDLEPLGVGTSSGYDALADLLVREGKLEAVPDAAYFRAYMQRIRYWNGTGWQTEPTWNARWEAAVAGLDSAARAAQGG